jgi:transposase InsO family protein
VRAVLLRGAAAIASATIGLVVPDAQRKDEPFGFCLASGGPGELVCLDSFYIGELKGVGKVYQLTAIDVFTRFAVTSIVLGTPNGAVMIKGILAAWPHLQACVAPGAVYLGIPKRLCPQGGNATVGDGSVEGVGAFKFLGTLCRRYRR